MSSPERRAVDVVRMARARGERAGTARPRAAATACAAALLPLLLPQGRAAAPLAVRGGVGPTQPGVGGKKEAAAGAGGGSWDDTGVECSEPARKTVAVTFEVRCDCMAREERVLLIGSEPALGNWDPLEAVEMATNAAAWPVWSATVTLPAGGIVEYKYAISTKRDWNTTAHGFNTTGPGSAGDLGLEGASGVAAAALRRYGSRVTDATGAGEQGSDANATDTNSSASGSSKRQDRSRSHGKNGTETQELEDWQFIRNGLVFDWEEGGNHLLKVGRRPHTVADEFLPPLRNPDPIPPSFVHGGKKSECFMDAEYSYIATD